MWPWHTLLSPRSNNHMTQDTVYSAFAVFGALNVRFDDYGVFRWLSAAAKWWVCSHDVVLLAEIAFRSLKYGAA